MTDCTLCRFSLRGLAVITVQKARMSEGLLSQVVVLCERFNVVSKFCAPAHYIDENILIMLYERQRHNFLHA